MSRWAVGQAKAPAKAPAPQSMIGFCAGLLLLCPWLALAQSISGVVHDSSGRALEGAGVQIQSESSGARWRAEADPGGRYGVSGLPSDRYKITVRMPGFRTVSRVGVVLSSGQDLALDFEMEWLTLHESITVSADAGTLDPSAGDRLRMTREAPGAALPTSGRDLRASFDLMPGIVVTPAAVSDAGQFTSNGQRPNASAYRVDGLSANTGVGGSALPGSFPGASLPAMTAFGSTEDLVSPETTQSVELQTSAFAPESGGRPGAQVLVATRPGTNDFHGEFFGHVRDNGWTARDWFANSRSLAFPRPYDHGIGGLFGGPVIRNRTFLFLSSEKGEVYVSGIQLTQVPSFTARANAPAGLQYALDQFPAPFGPDFSDGTAPGALALSRTGSFSNSSARLDQSLGSHGNLFVRLVSAPSESQSQSFDLSTGKLNWTSGSVGLILGQTEHAIHDLRFNYSRSRYYTHLEGLFDPVFDLAGLNSVNKPEGFTVPFNAATVFGISIPDLGQFVGGVMGIPRQSQTELRYGFSWETGRHQFRAGADAIRLTPSRDMPGATILAVAPGLQNLLTGGPVAVTYSSFPQFGGHIDMASIWLQDTMRISDRLTVLYGLRWELTPPVGNQSQLAAVSGIWMQTAWQSVRSGNVFATAPWPMRYGQIAPRAAVAYRLARSAVVLRAGAGLFRDTALGGVVDPINGAPFNSWLVSSEAGGVVSAAGIANPAAAFPNGVNAPDVLRFLSGAAPPLRLPASWQWRISAERAAGVSGVVSAAYVAALGRDLVGNAAYLDPQSGTLDRSLTWTRGSSDYQALQLRYTGVLGHGLFGSLAYTWSHSIDDGSQDSSVFLIHPGYALNEARGSSSFDMRHALTAAISYQLPRSGRLPSGLANWTISGILRARSGFPIDVLTGPLGLGRGFDNVGRPDLLLGQPLWIDDPSAAGGRRLNPGAFSVPGAGPGDLGRDAFAGNGLAQVDLSLRREFPIYGRASLTIGVSVFNLLNHPAFADPVPYLSSPWFGQSTSMQNLMLGSGTPNTGLPPLFQTGGSRSAELTFRFVF